MTASVVVANRTGGLPVVRTTVPDGISTFPMLRFRKRAMPAAGVLEVITVPVTGAVLLRSRVVDARRAGRLPDKSTEAACGLALRVIDRLCVRVSGVNPTIAEGKKRTSRASTARTARLKNSKRIPIRFRQRPSAGTASRCMRLRSERGVRRTGVSTAYFACQVLRWAMAAVLKIGMPNSRAD